MSFRIPCIRCTTMFEMSQNPCNRTWWLSSFKNGFWDRKGMKWHFNQFCHRTGCANVKHYKYEMRCKNLSRNTCKSKLLKITKMKKSSSFKGTIKIECPHGSSDVKCCFYNVSCRRDGWSLCGKHMWISSSLVTYQEKWFVIKLARIFKRLHCESHFLRIIISSCGKITSHVDGFCKTHVLKYKKWCLWTSWKFLVKLDEWRLPQRWKAYLYWL